VATYLRLDKVTALRRIRVAVDRGYLRNLEEHKGRPYRLIMGDPLPRDVTVLPTVETLTGCAVAVKTGGIDTLPPLPVPLADVLEVS